MDLSSVSGTSVYLANDDPIRNLPLHWSFNGRNVQTSDCAWKQQGISALPSISNIQTVSSAAVFVRALTMLFLKALSYCYRTAFLVFVKCGVRHGVFDRRLSKV